MSKPTILLPGEQIPSDVLQSKTSNPLRLGSGVRLLNRSAPNLQQSNSSSSSSSSSTHNTHELVATHAGLLSTDGKRNTVTIHSFPQHRYIPTVNDLVIAQVHRSSQDYFHCVITPHAPLAVLGQLAFEGASKKTRPALKQGDLVYARVLSVGVGAGTEIELTCVNPATGKAEPGGLGPLTGGMVFDVSTGLAARLMMKTGSEVVVLEELGRKLESMGGFEIAVGRNGRVWVDCSSSNDNNNSSDIGVRITIALGQCLQQLDRRNLTPAEQRKLVSRVLRDLKIDF